jgi:hypothetical protein
MKHKKTKFLHMETKSIFSKLKPFAIVFLLFFSLSASAQKEKLQTALIYQLTRLVEWCPDGKQGDFVIGVVGNDPAFMAEIKLLQSRRVGTQEINIKSFATVGDITKSNILFVTDSEYDNLKTIASATDGFCSLIVSDRSGGANRGAGVSIVYNERAGKLEFEINRNYMRRNSLNVSDQLYNIASTIY